ncbi:hypothetical protein BD410DRAFT_893534 [Rickenella mellea]|uniref:Uncharacterized protein n=1 Tax=Rickenella mellea TaxID=50990 RepID=A0A4Y7QNS0_9AGAM|nr:hypothetical protein BD410DRAFT_893534 [Rickenella mellea]
MSRSKGSFAKNSIRHRTHILHDTPHSFSVRRIIGTSVLLPDRPVHEPSSHFSRNCDIFVFCTTIFAMSVDLLFYSDA